MASQDYYSVLGVSKDATGQEIKRAFRQIARECHPDVSGGDPRAEERFKDARKAYETLMDPVTRARYDRRGKRRMHAGGSFFDAFYKATEESEEAAKAKKTGPSYAGHTTGGYTGSKKNKRYDPGNDLDLDDLFNDFGEFGFGGRTRRGATRPSGAGQRVKTETPRNRSPQQGSDVHIELDVPGRVAHEGGSVTAVYYRMQRADSWRPGSADPGVVRVQDIADVRIIPATRDGEVLRERGLGDAGPFGGPYGDLVVRVRVSADAGRTSGGDPARSEEAPREEGNSVGEETNLVTLDISVVEALLGGRVQLKTPQGNVRLTVPPCTSSGARLRLKGKGPAGGDGHPTDLYVSLRIVTPRSLDDESRRLIEAFAKLNPDDPRG